MTSKTYRGSCHCGLARFTATLSPPLESSSSDEAPHEVMSCNCSICARNGYLFVYPKVEDVVFEQGQDSLTGYKFYTNQVEHKFCPTCGTSVCLVPTEEMEFLKGKIAVNIRTLEDVDLEKLKLKKFDGKTQL
ncbi:MAG: hypothetical protein M1816_000103 [Peltula sp. TS41687]|nr:MAG: hypothetical protein M1816_000103 [Peltula sp. TS41687]